MSSSQNVVEPLKALSITYSFKIRNAEVTLWRSQCKMIARRQPLTYLADCGVWSNTQEKVKIIFLFFCNINFDVIFRMVFGRKQHDVCLE